MAPKDVLCALGAMLLSKACVASRAHAESPTLSVLAAAGSFDGLATGITLRQRRAALVASIGVGPSLVFYLRPEDPKIALPQVLLRADSTLTFALLFALSIEPKYTLSAAFGGRWHSLYGPALWVGLERRSQLTKRVGFLIYGGLSVSPSAGAGLSRVLEHGSRVYPVGPYASLGGNFALEFALF